MPQVVFHFLIIFTNMSYSLFELNEFIRRVLALNLHEPVWVKCELAQVKMSRGHCYLELVEKSENGAETIAQSGGVIWNHQLKKLRRKMGIEMEALLREGMQVMLSVKVDFHEKYGLKLMVEDIDPAYTLGKMELQKQATIRALQAEHLMDKNGQLPLPSVVQRLAVLSSETAAGLHDFMQQLAENPYGYHFKTRLFPTAMQGEKVATELTAQLERIKAIEHRFDAVVIIRGGGAKLDLKPFDELEICRAVAEFTLPAIVGIGHEVDETVLDLVAHSSLKTPTAVAEFILRRAMQFEAETIELGNFVKHFAEQKITEEKAGLEQLFQLLRLQSKGIARHENLMLDFIQKEVSAHAFRILENEKMRSENLSNSVELLKPETAFRRGFSLTSKGGKILTSPEQLKEGEQISTQLKKGEIISIVKKE